jgi:hypothetical protein
MPSADHNDSPSGGDHENGNNEEDYEEEDIFASLQTAPERSLRYHKP